MKMRHWFLGSIVLLVAVLIVGLGETTTVYLSPSDLSETTFREYRIPLTRIPIWKSVIGTRRSYIYEQLLLLDPEFKSKREYDEILISEMSWRWKDGDCAYKGLVSRKEGQWLDWIAEDTDDAHAVWLNALQKLRDQPNSRGLDAMTGDLITSRFSN